METNTDVLKKINEIEEDIESLDKEIKKILDKETKEKKYRLYKGVQTFFSPIVYKPKLMIIGINPGNGYFKQNNEKPIYKLHKVQPEKCVEFLTEDKNNKSGYLYNYSLARTLRELLQIAECGDLKKQIVMTNIFPFATTNEKELHELMSVLKKNGINRPYGRCYDFLRLVIQILQPKVILIMGKSAFDIFYKENNCTDKEDKKDYITTTYKNSIKVIGFRRNRSIISGDKNLLAKKLNEIINT